MAPKRTVATVSDVSAASADHSQVQGEVNFEDAVLSIPNRKIRLHDQRAGIHAI